MKTSCGTIGLELYGDKAPQTVASFIFLSRKKYYDGSPCHRLTSSPALKVLQCGDPTGTGTGGPGYGYGIENAPEGRPLPRRHAGDGAQRLAHQQRQPVLHHLR